MNRQVVGRTIFPGIMLAGSILVAIAWTPIILTATPYAYQPLPPTAFDGISTSSSATEPTPTFAPATPPPTPTIVATLPPTSRPKPTIPRDVPPVRLKVVAGVATFYDDGPGLYAAAGPTLRHALGAHWRGKLVRVRYTFDYVVVIAGVEYQRTMSREETVVLSDWCACGRRHGKPTVLDLSLFTFARLTAPPAGGVGLGVIEVKVYP